MKYKYEIWCSKQGITYGDYYLQDGTNDITMAIHKAMNLYMAGDASTQIRVYKNEKEYITIQYVREIECQYKDPETGEVIKLDTFYKRMDDSDDELAAFLDDAIEQILDDNEEYDSEDIYCYWSEKGFNRCYTSGMIWNEVMT